MRGSGWCRPARRRSRTVARADLTRRHEQFAADRFGGSEWFHLTPGIAEHAGIVAGGRDPWDVYARWMSEAAALSDHQRR